MINSALYKRELKGSWKLLVIFGSVLAMYYLMVIPMFDPALGSALNEFAKAMPELMAMVGMNPSSNTLVGFISAYLYGFLMLVFPMVYSILCANKLIAKHVENGSMTYLVSAPVKRMTIVITQMAVLITGIIIIMVFSTVLGLIACAISFPNELDIEKYLMINIGVLGLQLFIGSICYLCSCIFNDTKYSVGFGAGIPTLAFVVQMMANVGDKLKNFKYATFFTLYNPDDIILGESGAIAGMVILFATALILYVVSTVVFVKKDLHI